jgi:hypothetical protein
MGLLLTRVGERRKTKRVMDELNLLDGENFYATGANNQIWVSDDDYGSFGQTISTILDPRWTRIKHT